MKQFNFLNTLIFLFLFHLIPNDSFTTEIFSNKVPSAYVVVKGRGESDLGIPPDPYETFSYDLALKEAQIENFNIVTYTSVLPKESYEVPINSVKKYFHFGAVLESIMSKTSGKKGDTVVAGLGRVWAQDEDGNEIGGFVAEYERIYSNKKVSAKTIENEAKKQLTSSLLHILKIRGFKQKGDIKFDIAYLNITKKYGTVLSVIGFINYVYPDPIPTLIKNR